MKVNELIETFNAMPDLSGDDNLRISAMGGMAGYPVIESASRGFDWNNHSVVLTTKTPLQIHVPVDKKKAEIELLAVAQAVMVAVETMFTPKTKSFYRACEVARPLREAVYRCKQRLEGYDPDKFNLKT